MTRARPGRCRPGPTWAEPHELGPYTVGIEEEVMLLDQLTWALAHRIDSVLPRLPQATPSFTAETQGSVLEIQTGVHASVGAAIEELAALRCQLDATLRPLSMRAAVAGTHPFAVWQEIVVSAGERYQFVYGSMRELARREPTFGLHVHVGVPDAEAAIRAANRLRSRIPLLLALSVNSPFWQGRDTGLASARTPLFQAFPRVGIPRAFRDYAEYVEAVDLLIRSGAIPEPTFLWWDVRPQPRFGTVEVRIMDARRRSADNAALAALVQSIVRRAVEEDARPADPASTAAEVLDENRFLAARDGMDAELIDHRAGRAGAGPRAARRPPRRLPPARRGPRLRGGAGSGRGGSPTAPAPSASWTSRARLGSLPRVVAVLADDFLA